VIGSVAQDVVEPHRSGHGRHSLQALEAVIARMPFHVRAISVDNGSEFMVGFESACERLGVRLFVLPPRSPKLHGTVERANRTHTEEFHEVTAAEPDPASLQEACATGRPSTTGSGPTRPLAAGHLAGFLATLCIQA
jgi:hypothetical protein